MPAQRSPFQDIEDVFERMSERFRPFEAELGAISVDVEDRDDEYVVTADVPGFDREEIDVEVQDDTVHIYAERSEETETEGEGEEAEGEGEYLRSERTHTAMSRTIRLPQPVDESAAEATHQNGVLTITLPKVEEEERTGTSIPIE